MSEMELTTHFSANIGERKSKCHSTPFKSSFSFENNGHTSPVSSFLRNNGTPDYIFEITEEIEEPSFSNGEEKPNDPLFDQAVDLIAREQKASTSFLQRHLQIGYNRAARIIDVMEAENMISAASQTGKREVLLNKK